MSEPGEYLDDENRFSRDYQITIASPEEEVHGRAVALFDFVRENDNELPLVEGQIILVSFRQTEGWLVAEDPRTGECGLVPEEYVRFLRDIEGGWNGLMNGTAGASNGHEGLLSPVSAGPEARTPTQADHGRISASGNERYTPVISTFSTSTRDLEPYPKDRLGTPTNAEEFTRQRDKSQDAADEKAEGPMEGVEASPEPPSQHQRQHSMEPQSQPQRHSMHEAIQA
jgi:hypothetical protein